MPILVITPEAPHIHGAETTPHETEGGRRVEKFDIFKDIAERTGGDIYMGVVGPVRTGKSTFIKRFMELLVLPNIKDPYAREQAKDELPQAGTGRMIMTTEPKFIPAEAVEITLKDSLKMRVRLVDCVGFSVPGAVGYEEQGGPRMVMTPWFEYEIPFEEAAEIGTRKVISEHSTMGLVVTTDGSITDIARDAYVDAEERVIRELKELGKPFVIVLNSVRPLEKEAQELSERLSAKYDVPVIPVDAAQMTVDDVQTLMEQVLYEFPVKEVNINLPAWVEELEPKHWLRVKFEEGVAEAVQGVRRLRDVDGAIEKLSGFDFVSDVSLRNMDMGTGVATVDLRAKGELFYQVLEEMSAYSLKNEADLVKAMKELAFAKKEYDVIAEALKDVRETGYGMVSPRLQDMIFEEPEMIKQGNHFGVKLKASAPSLHFIRADVETEVTPIIGTEKQGEEMVKFLLREFEGDPKKIWQSDMFGKSMHDLVREGIQNKLFQMPENAQQKLQETIQRIVNEGSGGLLCIII
jgi:stage IV sporulation protein A